jgi:ribosomal-protein-alanine N-acetyltransferase
VLDIDEAFLDPGRRTTSLNSTKPRHIASGGPELLNHRDDQPHSLHALLQRLRGTSKPAPTLAGYGGCWLIAGESHVSTLAVHPAYRGRGLGEALLVGMLRRAINLGGEYSVLEVRVSNLTAQALYRKYEYETIGRRGAIYRDNGEDAFLMEVRPR